MCCTLETNIMFYIHYKIIIKKRILFGHEREGNSFVSIWMKMEGIILSKKKAKQRKTNTMWCHLYVEY